jgi:hypothetical protein
MHLVTYVMAYFDNHKTNDKNRSNVARSEPGLPANMSKKISQIENIFCIITQEIAKICNQTFITLEKCVAKISNHRQDFRGENTLFIQ